MRWHCRCRVCGARQVRRQPAKHVFNTVAPRYRCRQCGRRGTLRLDKYMNTRKLEICACQAYHFIHRKGSGKCYYRIYDHEAFEERAAIAEFDGKLEKHEAEELAYQEQHVFSELE